MGSLLQPSAAANMWTTSKMLHQYGLQLEKKKKKRLVLYTILMVLVTLTTIILYYYTVYYALTPEV